MIDAGPCQAFVGRSPFIRKLMHSGQLTEDDCDILANIGKRTRSFAAHEDIIVQGQEPSDVHLITSGFAIRYKLLADGSRSIIGFLISGDIGDLHGSILKRMDHSIAALTECEVAVISMEEVGELMRGYPRIGRALWWSVLQDQGTLREWLVSMGRREAPQQIAHLLCELLIRLRVVGLAGEDRYSLPVTQDELADTAGISAIHVNRVIQHLRGLGLIELSRKALVIPDVRRLEEFADFDPSYLHLQGVAGERG